MRPLCLSERAGEKSTGAASVNGLNLKTLKVIFLFIGKSFKKLIIFDKLNIFYNTIVFVVNLNYSNFFILQEKTGRMGKEVTTEDICRARDIRMEKTGRYFKKSTEGVILFLLNIPGSIKDSSLYRKVFNSGLRTIKYHLNKNCISYSVQEVVFPESGTGPEAYISVAATDLLSVKKITAEIENSHPAGRIFDIDLFDKNLEQVKSGREMRKCFICDRPAFECARSRKHPLHEVVENINKISENYFDSLIWKIAANASRAMMTEVLVTPKPGLVDRANSGAHADMDIFTFTDSTSALVKTFYDMASEGFSFGISEKEDLETSCSEFFPSGIIKENTADNCSKEIPPEGENNCPRINTGNYSNSEDDLTQLLEPLRKIGRRGEKAMFEITNGVNTQKGLIFSIGILSGAAGYLAAKSRDEITPELLCITGKKIVKGITEKDFNRKTGSETKKNSNADISSTMPEQKETGPDTLHQKITTGEKLFRKYGIKGARGEAEGGFRSSLRALTILKTHLENEWDLNLSLADTLIHIISETEDTNIPGRNSIKTLTYAEDKCRAFIKDGGVFRDNGIEELEKLDKDFIDKNISPGGSADILATTLFLYFIENELKN